MRTQEQLSFAKLLRAAVLAFILAGTISLVAYSLFSWQREHREVRENLRILSGFLASASDAFFENIGNGLPSLGQLLDREGVLRQPEFVRGHLMGFQTLHPEIRAVAIFAPDGEMLINTALAPGQPLPDFRRDPPYLKQLMKDMAAYSRFTVTPPEFGKALQRWRFSIRHVVRDAAGQPRFMVQVSIPLEREGTFLHQLPTPENSFIGLLRTDSYQQARWPDDPGIYGKRSEGPAAKLIRNQPGIKSGFFEGQSHWSSSRGHRMGAITRLRSQPMYAYVSVPGDYIWRSWWRHNAPVLLAFAFFLPLFGFIAWRVTQHERRHSLELLKQARRDALTGLPNRAAAEELVNMCIRVSRLARQQFCVLFIDIDRFKDINDSLGHAVGDTLLVNIAHVINAVLRDDDSLCRLGGDEFLVVLPATGEDAAIRVAERLLGAFESPLEVGEHHLQITPSIGVALYPQHGEVAGTLLQHADTAMYEAKRQGRNAYTFYADHLGERVRRRMELERQLREAVREQRFAMHYQPIVDMRTGRIAGAEALLRWIDGDRVLSPGSFLDVAEDSGLIIPIGEWMLHHVCHQVKTWHESGIELYISINISPRQFHDPQLVEKMERALKESGVEPHMLEVEITETAAMTNPEESLRVLNRLRALGLRLSIDDFGTGYSSLSYLKRIPASKIKIDKSFIDGVNVEPDDTAIVHTILALGAILGKEVIAEGIENGDQYEALAGLGCEFAQGYWISRPIEPDALIELLARGLGQGFPQQRHAAEQQ